MFTRLLVPLDGSHLAEAVLPIVERIAIACSASVVLLHVIERSAQTTVHGDRHLSATGEATAYLEQVAARLRAKGIDVAYHTHDVPQGDVARSIVEHAEEECVDLAVLCTHGRGSLRDLIFGSIAQQVVHQGTTPVLLARPDANGAQVFAPRTVLVTLDASPAAEHALAPAQELACKLGAALHLVMVVPTRSTVRGERHVTARMLPSAARAALELQEHDAAEYLQELAARPQPTGLVVTTEVRRGDTAAALADEAAEPGVGLVIAATHGRAGLQAVWAGSVTAQLLARTRAPVLLLRTIDV